MTDILYLDNDTDYDFGIDKLDKSINYVNIGSEGVLLKQNEVLNPLFVNIGGGTLDTIKARDVYDVYGNVLVICTKKQYRNSQDAFKIFDKILDKTELPTIGRCFTHMRTSVNLLKNNVFRQRTLVLTDVDLKMMFPESVFEVSELVLPLFELDEESVQVYAQLYDRTTKLSDLEYVINAVNHYNKSYKAPIEEQFRKKLMNLKESLFWTNKQNCNMNMTDVFMGRKLDFADKQDNHSGIVTIKSDNTIKARNTTVDGVTNVFKSKTDDGNKDYLNFIHNKKNSDYTDLFSAFKDDKNRKYYATSESSLEFSKKFVTDLVLSTTDDKELFYLFNSLLVSKEYCHMVVNNAQILEKMKPLFDKHKIVYKYLFGYAWLCFYLEECIFKTKTTKQSRYVLDINTANKLPTFPLCFEDMTQNPYLTLLVDNKKIDVSNNAISLGFIADHTGYGVCNLEQFKSRFNLFTTGDSSKNIFDGINWKDFAISGSVIPACMQKQPALLSIVSNPSQSEDDKWLTYFNNYYQDSDIDIMCNDPSVFGFIEKALDVYQKIRTNIGCKETEIEFEPIKTMAIIVTKHFNTEKLDDIRDKLDKQSWQPDDVAKNISSFEMKEYLYSEYVDNKRKFNTQLRKSKKIDMDNDFVKGFTKMSSIDDMSLHISSHETTKKDNTQMDSELCFYINDFRSETDKVPEDKNFLVIKFSENIKFKIRSPKMRRSVELFRVKNEDFFGVVGKFHLPCVRAYYTGDNVYITPSCVTAMMTGVNIEYKYFAGVRDPIEIINKYMMRGFSTILNPAEIKHFMEYNAQVDINCGMFSTKGLDNPSKKLLGAKDINSDIFKPQVFKNGLPRETYKTVEFKYLNSLDDLKKYYAEKLSYDNTTGIDMFKFKFCNSDGSIAPVQMNAVELYYESTSNK